MVAWLIRHGESEANLGLRTQNPTDIPLTPRGYAQARRICNLLPLSPDLVVTSQYIRTQQTAKPTLERFTEAQHQEWTIHEFTFLSPVKFANTTIEERRPAAQAYWEKADLNATDTDGAESFADFMGRVRLCYDNLITIPDNQFVVVFTHETFMQALIWSLMTGWEITSDKMRRFRQFSRSFSIPNTAILQLKWEQSGCWYSPILTDHLDKEA